MYVKIHGNKEYTKGNAGSCSDLAQYLEKENLEKDFAKSEQFFNQSKENINVNEVIRRIDNNKKGLKKDEAKFYMITINPHERELKHLAKMATKGKDISDISQMNSKELEAYNNYLKEYTRKVMDEYAKSFNRELTGNDILYYSKLEQNRYWKGYDESLSNKVAELKKDGKSLEQIHKEFENKNLNNRNEIPNFYKNGIVVQDERKPGLQSHVHVIVSRKDINMKHSLSPHAKSRASTRHKLNGKNVTVGMNRDEFVNRCEKTFDNAYSYNRNYAHSYDNYKYEKNPMTYVKLAEKSFEKPEQAMKSAAMMGIEKLSKGAIPAHRINTIVNVAKNPETAKDALVNQLNMTINKLLPPKFRVAKQIAEQLIKPISQSFKI